MANTVNLPDLASGYPAIDPSYTKQMILINEIMRKTAQQRKASWDSIDATLHSDDSVEPCPKKRPRIVDFNDAQLYPSAKIGVKSGEGLKKFKDDPHFDGSWGYVDHKSEEIKSEPCKESSEEDSIETAPSIHLHLFRHLTGEYLNAPYKTQKIPPINELSSIKTQATSSNHRTEEKANLMSGKVEPSKSPLTKHKADPLDLGPRTEIKLSKLRPAHLSNQSQQRDAFICLKRDQSLIETFQSHSDSLERIVLFLDIDNTLLQCVTSTQLSKYKGLSLNSKPINLPGESRFVVLRPYVIQFIERISKFCELWIYTSGQPEYAKEVVRVLDPSHKYFGNRVLSARNLEETRTKTLSRAKQLKDFDETMALVIDDRKDTWIHDSHCVLRSLKYAPICDPADKDYFIYSRQMPRFVDMQGWTKETLRRPQLQELADVLESLYASFIETDARFTIPYLLNEIRQGLLVGLNLDFSRYELRLGFSTYTPEKLTVLKRVAQDLGGCSGATFYVVERPQVQDEVSAAWLLSCYFFVNNS